eukprot:3934133-Rhodomonas_salina.6
MRAVARGRQHYPGTISAICLRSCYAVSGTEVACIVQRKRYAPYGTSWGIATTQCPVLTLFSPKYYVSATPSLVVIIGCMAYQLLGMCPYFVTTPLLTTKPKVMEGLKMVGA